MMSEPNNPFAGLLGVPEVKLSNDNEYSADNTPLDIDLKKSQEDDDVETINSMVENIFHFTINPKFVEGPTSDRQLVYLEELAVAISPKINIDLETLEQALFERLLLQDVESSVIPKSSRACKEHIVQKQVFPYLFSSLQNLQSYDHVNSALVQNALQKMRELIFRNAVTALKQPALFEEQDFSIQLVELLQHVDPQSHTFFVDLVKAFIADGKNIFRIVIQIINSNIRSFTPVKYI